MSLISDTCGCRELFLYSRIDVVSADISGNKLYCDKNGIADGSYIFKTHDYRHTLATQFYDEDVSIQTIRDYLGHFSEEMTKQYVDFMPKRIEKASDTYFKKPENDLASTIKAKKRGERK